MLLAAIVVLLILVYDPFQQIRENFSSAPYTGVKRYHRARYVAHSWENASKDTEDLHNTMERFDVPIHPTDDYLNDAYFFQNHL